MKRLIRDADIRGTGYDFDNREYAILYVEGEVFFGQDHYELMLDYTNKNGLDENYFDEKTTEWASACLVDWNNIPNIDELYERLPIEAFNEIFANWKPNTKRVFVDDYVYGNDIHTLANKMKKTQELSKYEFFVNQPEDWSTLQQWFGSELLEDCNLVDLKDYTIYFHDVL